MKTSEKINPVEVLKKHWCKKKTTIEFDEQTEQHLDYAISAIREFSQLTNSETKEALRNCVEVLEQLQKIHPNTTLIGKQIELALEVAKQC